MKSLGIQNKIDFKNLKLIKNKNHIKDPPRYPNVINVYEGSSIKSFKESLELEIKQLMKEINNFI